jgi:sugar phosphate isomerase/epimerase
MWRYHPDNGDPAAWADLVSTLQTLLTVARSANVTLGIEPEHANVIASAALARKLLDELGTDHLSIVMDPANLVSGLSLAHQESVLAEAFELLAPYVVIAHAKDVSKSGYHAAGRGLLDYDEFFRLISRHQLHVPIVLHDVVESDLRRARDFVAGFANKWRPAASG